MIDIFALGLTHALMALAAWRLLARADLDRDGAPVEPRRKSWQRRDHDADDSEAGDA